MNKSELGLVHVYTGDGKGKTTASLGLIMRAIGGGLSVCYVSFHKNPEKYGYCEMESLKKLGAHVLNRAIGHPHLDESLDNVVIASEVVAAMDEITKLISEKHFDLLVLDEILIAVRDGYMEENILLDFIANKPQNMELVITGRMATDAVMDMADYVSYVEKRKHPYDKGITSRKGIEM